MATRGRPPTAAGALTAAERKAAQRRRDHVAIWRGTVLADATLTGLQAAVGHCIIGGHADELALVLQEIGRRGGLKVSAVKA